MVVQERELEFRCECGGTTSVQRLSIRTLPRSVPLHLTCAVPKLGRRFLHRKPLVSCRVLVLHLVRFRHTPFLGLEKIQDPVKLPRDMFVSSNQVRRSRG